MREPKKFPNEEDYSYLERYYNYKAFLARCRTTQIKQSHKNNEQFPYSAV